MSAARADPWFGTRTGRTALAVVACAASGDWRRPLLGSLAQWWSWGLVAPLILAVDRLLPSSDKQLARRLLLHFLLSLPVTAAYIYVFAAALALFGIESWRTAYDPMTLLVALRGMFLWSWLVYWLIVGAWLKIPDDRPIHW